MSIRPDQTTELRFVATNTFIVRDIPRSVAFYRDVLGCYGAARGRAHASAARQHLAHDQWRWRSNRRQAGSRRFATTRYERLK